MERRERRSNKFLVTIVILLLITVGVLLLLLLWPSKTSSRVPTGRVDEFDIEINGICKSRNDEDCFGGGDNDSYGSVEERGIYYDEEKKINGKTDTDIAHEGIVYVDDNNGRYVYQRTLKIFENPAFEYENKIAPGVSNSYNFRVHNETDAVIRYNVEFLESSEYAINMRFRLKRNGYYILGSDSGWVSADDLIASLKDLAMDSADSYTLDWEWPFNSGNDELDTQIGENMASEYSLEIKINFEVI